jgi:ribose 5-phosphate isomerase B
MNNLLKLFLASDHAAFEFKARLKTHLKEYLFEDLGCDSTQSVDYPDYAEILSKRVGENPLFRGILICGSGIGMSIAANKMPGIRAALVENPVSARLAREHNDANVLCLGARFLAPEYAAEIARVFLQTPASPDQRHTNRVKKLNALDHKK